MALGIGLGLPLEVGSSGIEDVLNPIPPAVGIYEHDVGIIGPAGVSLMIDNGDYLSSPMTADYQSQNTSFTVAVWFKGTLLGGGTGTNYILAASAPGQVSIFDFQYSGGLIFFQLFTGSINTSNRSINITTGADYLWKLAIGWYDHVAHTINLQINDGAVSSGATGVVIGNAVCPIQIGARNAANFFQGHIGPIAKWNRVLTAGERTWYFNNESARTFDDIQLGQSSLLIDLKSYHALEETVGQNRLDSVGSTSFEPFKLNGLGPLKIIVMEQREDLSGSGNHLTSPVLMTNRPTWIEEQFNGQPAIENHRITGSNGTYSFSPNIGLDVITELTVLEIVQRSTNTVGYIPWNNNNGISGLSIRNRNSSVDLDNVQNSTLVASTLSIPPVEEFRLMRLQYLGSASRAFAGINNSAGSSFTHAPTLGGNNFFELGRSSPTAHTSGKHGSLRVWKRILTDDQLDRVEREMMEEWGITRGMPDRIINKSFSGTWNTPSVVRVNANTLIVVSWRNGQNKVYTIKSINNGRSWEEPLEKITPASSTTILTHLGPTKTISGKIIIPVVVNHAVGNPTSEVWISTNDGDSYTLAQSIPVSGYIYVFPYGKIREKIIAGIPTILMPAYGINGDTTSDNIIMQSINDGQSWTKRSVCALHGTPSVGKTYSEPDIINISNAVWLSINREDTEPQEVGRLYSSFSNDDGLTWGTPTLLFDGVSPHLVKVGSTILLFYTHRDLAFPTPIRGILCRKSIDGGINWSDPVQLYSNPTGILYHGYEDIIEDMSNSEFGMVYQDDSQTLKWTHFLRSMVL